MAINGPQILAVFKVWPYYSRSGRCGGLVVSVLVFGSSSLGSSPGLEDCVLFFGKLLSQCLSLLRCIHGTGEFNVVGNPAMN